jgi:hypothetical protein
MILQKLISPSFFNMYLPWEELFFFRKWVLGLKISSVEEMRQEILTVGSTDNLYLGSCNCTD